MFFLADCLATMRYSTGNDWDDAWASSSIYYLNSDPMRRLRLGQPSLALQILSYILTTAFQPQGQPLVAKGYEVCCLFDQVRVQRHTHAMLD